MDREELNQISEPSFTSIFEDQSSVLCYSVHLAKKVSTKWVLLIPGLGGNENSGKYLYPHLSSDANLIVLTLPFYRQTAIKRGLANDSIAFSKSMERLLNYIAKEYTIEELTVIGHSIGGIYAIDYAITHKNKIDKLVLLCPAGFSSRDQFLFKLFRMQVVRKLIQNDLLVKIASRRIWRSNDLKKQLLFENQLKNMFCNTQGFDLLYRNRLHLLYQIQCAVQIIWAKDDKIASFSTIDDAKNHFQFGSSHILQKGGHNLLKTRPNVIAKVLTE